MQGCGNDFVIIDYDEYQKTSMQPSELALKVCERHFGIGADGMIIPILHSKKADLSWYFYNSDGSKAQMCGNGMRCFAKYIHDKNIIKNKEFSVETGAGIIKPQIIDSNTVKVNMGKPVFEYEKIPYTGRSKEITVCGKTFQINPVSMGNPHCVIFTDENPMELAEKYGPYIEKHEYFPEKTNTEFVKVISKNEADMCVFERGCGITPACRTGACATAAAGILNNLTESKIKINLPGGSVFVEWQGNSQDFNKDIFLTGPANYSFFGEYIL